MQVELTRPEIRAARWALANRLVGTDEQAQSDFFGTPGAAKAAKRAYEKFQAACEKKDNGKLLEAHPYFFLTVKIQAMQLTKLSRKNQSHH